MPVMEAIAHVARAATEPVTPRERAALVLDALRQIIPYDHAELTFRDPTDGSARVLANAGYDDDVLAYLTSSDWDEQMRSLPEHAIGVPVRVRDVAPGTVARRGIETVLVPAGYNEGMTQCLYTTDGRCTGVLNLSLADDRHPNDEQRDVMHSLGPALANVVDATQSPRYLLSLLDPRTHAVALDGRGGVVALPGIADHPLLVDGGQVAAIAHAASVGQGGRRSDRRFLWPGSDRRWHRVAVVSCNDGLGAWDGLLTLLPDAVELTLTRREIEVLTLLTAGWSNAAIGSHLWISPRTVATYVEQVLSKLGVPTRAAAAARAIAEGLVVPLAALEPS